jgi:hypothetical protein
MDGRMDGRMEAGFFGLFPFDKYSPNLGGNCEKKYNGADFPNVHQGIKVTSNNGIL